MRAHFLLVLAIIAIFCTIFEPTLCFPSKSSNAIRKWRREAEPLDPENKYLLSWEVDLDTEVVTFNVVVETRGFVGFGISPSGNMIGADIFIGGVDSISGFNYYFDMHGVANGPPIRDERNDWKLLSAAENATHTSVRFSRLLNTCDEQDYAIGEDTTRVIWSYGPTDTVEYHGVNRGSTSFNLIEPPIPDVDLTKYRKWEINVNSTMAAMDTSYFCTMHKSPNFITKNHIVALGAVLDNMDAKKHTHHFTLMECRAPPGESGPEIFEPWLYPAYEGHECYDPRSPLPLHLCSQITYVWAVGGKMTIFPENVGLPTAVGETYYMLEIHYDNPGIESGKAFKTGLEIYHGENLRDIEAAIFIQSYTVDPALLVPPSTSDFMIGSSCPAECTQSGLPPQGITVMNVLLHSHLSGRQIKFRHFRSGQELPWILADQNYDFNFQQNKPLREPVQILPGDELRVECIYDTKWKNGQVVLGGFASRDEMCEAIFYYYPKIEMFACHTGYPFPELMKDLGVTNYTIEYPQASPQFKATIIEPEELAGDFEQVLNSKYAWNEEIIAKLKQNMRYGDQVYSCGEKQGFMKHPTFDKEYFPPDKCTVV
jgi:hypothetical protein